MDTRLASIGISSYYYYYTKMQPPHPLNLKNETRGDKEEAADFVVEHYDLKLDVGSTLKATADLQLSVGNLAEYRFTLYHGYEILSVKNEKGEKVPFSRDNDYFVAMPTGPVERLIITYRGDGLQFYCNHQGMNLPGYFTWYPHPGYQKVWDYDNMYYYLETDLLLTDFHIKVNSMQKVYSNLPEVGKNEFAGTTDGATLVAGIYTEEVIDGVTYVYSPGGYQSIDGMDELVNQWDELWSGLLGDETPPLLENRKVIILSRQNVINNMPPEHDVVLMQDQILLNQQRIELVSMDTSYMASAIPETEGNALMRQLFLNTMESWDVSYEETPTKPAYESFDVLKAYYGQPIKVFQTNGELGEAYDKSRQALEELRIYQIHTMGYKEVVRQMYAWLTDELPDGDTVEQTIDFLYNMDVVTEERS